MVNEAELLTTFTFFCCYCVFCVVHRNTLINLCPLQMIHLPPPWVCQRSRPARTYHVATDALLLASQLGPRQQLFGLWRIVSGMHGICESSARASLWASTVAALRVQPPLPRGIGRRALVRVPPVGPQPHRAVPLLYLRGRSAAATASARESNAASASSPSPSPAGKSLCTTVQALSP